MRLSPTLVCGSTDEFHTLELGIQNSVLKAHHSLKTQPAESYLERFMHSLKFLPSTILGMKLLDRHE